MVTEYRTGDADSFQVAEQLPPEFHKRFDYAGSQLLAMESNLRANNYGEARECLRKAMTAYGQCSLDLQAATAT
jgi:hypothetical protein